MANIPYRGTEVLVQAARGIAAEVTETEHHLHNKEKWFGLAVTADGEDHVADNIDDYTNLNVVAPFQIDAGNDNWGAWVQILGAEDTPSETGKTKFDLHRIQIVDSETTNVHSFVQIGWGASGAAALTAGNYTTFAYLTPTNQAAESPIDFIMERLDAGTKVWARCLAVSENTMTLDFYIGLHEYTL